MSSGDFKSCFFVLHLWGIFYLGKQTAQKIDVRASE